MTSAHIEYIPEVVVPGKRLGRHVHVQARRLAVPYAGPRVTVVNKVWNRLISILDQGDVGSCTGNATVGALGSAPFFALLPVSHPVLDENEALRIYSEAETIDGDGPYPPNDNGSTGPSVAQAAKNDGLIADYSHYTDLDSTLQALMNGPVILGVNWYSSFDNPASDGTVSIDAGAFVRGGHEIVARSVDVDNKMIGLDNSWGSSWGVNGSFRMSFDTLSRLLSEGGDCTAFIPLETPVPVPTPTPVPQPTPEPSKPSWWDEFINWITHLF